MRRLLLLATVLFVLATGPASGVVDRAVSIAGFAFNPSPMDITTGDSVVWTNNDGSSHNIVAASFASPTELLPGQTYRRTFDTEGDYTYDCTLHNGMTGLVRVRTAPAPVVPEVPMPILLGASASLATAIALWTRRARETLGPRPVW